MVRLTYVDRETPRQHEVRPVTSPVPNPRMVSVEGSNRHIETESWLVVERLDPYSRIGLMYDRLASGYLHRFLRMRALPG